MISAGLRWLCCSISVTGSSKTECICGWRPRCCVRGRSAESGAILISLPAVVRFHRRLSDTVRMLHSGLGDGARTSPGTACTLVFRARPAGDAVVIFTPIADLGLVLVDRADPSFKQTEGFPVFSVIWPSCV